MKALFGMLALPAKHLETIVIFSTLSVVTTALVYLVTTLKPSISAFRIAIITLGSTMICSVLICLMSGYIRSHSHRKLTFPVRDELTGLESKPLPDQVRANSNLFDVVASTE